VFGDRRLVDVGAPAGAGAQDGIALIAVANLGGSHLPAE
jgi:hypothetical protein